MLPVCAEPFLFRKYIYTRLAPVYGSVLYYRCSCFVLTGDQLYIGNRNIPPPVVFCVAAALREVCELKNICECRIAQSEIKMPLLCLHRLKYIELHLP